MHLSEEALQSYIDLELTDDQKRAAEAHLAECNACRQALEVTGKRKERNFEAMNALAPSELPDPAALRSRLPADVSAMGSRRIQWRPAYAAIFALVALLAAFSFEPVRVWATEFLRLFRVQQITVLQIDPANLQRLEQSMLDSDGQRRIEQLLSDDAHVEKRGKVKSAASANEAAKLSGFGIRMPHALHEPSRITVHPAVDISFSIDVERLQAILDDSGQTAIRVPENLDGEMIHIRIPSSVTAFFGTCPDPKEEQHRERPERKRYPDCKVVAQLPAPSVVAPPSLDIEALGVEMLKFFGINDEQATKISKTIDWTSTLVIPLPAGNMKFTEVDVDGVKGNLFTSTRLHRDRRPPGYNLVWIRDGILYSLIGHGETSQALEIANSM